MNKRNVALILAIRMLMNPGMSMAAPTIPGFYGKVTAPAVNTLPVPRGSVTGATIDQSGNQMNITQNQGQANITIDWNSFNIGAAAAVRFYQGTGTPGTASWKPNSSYAALNRIYDKNPSQIYGKLQADGKVYLINQNGILFGRGSQVNVHLMAASALNIKPSDFVNGLLKFTSDPAYNYLSPGSAFSSDGVIANHGTIETDSGGTVVLLGPRVENSGSINAPLGLVALMSVLPSGKSGFDVDASGGTVNPYSTGVNGGTTVNYSGGVLSAESGQVRLFGATVEHNGIIRSVTTVRQNGQIELRASDRVTTGKDSVISSAISDSSETIVTSSDNPYKGGAITISGLNSSTPAKRVELSGEIAAPFGTVNLSASERVYLESGSSIDVSGLWVDKPAGSNLIDVQMNSVNLKDDYGQKDGIIKGETVTINPLYGSKIGSDISGYLTSAEKSARDQSTKGGMIDISVTSGDIIQKTDANLNFSGGGFNYAEGNAATTKLVSGNKVYDLSNAPEWLSYSKILGTQTTSHDKWGAKDVFKGLYFGGGNAVNDRCSAYSQGSDAGTLSLRAANVVLDGGISGKATAGVYQTARTASSTDDRLVSVLAGLETPLGGTMIIGNAVENDAATADHRLGDVVLSNEVAPLAGNFASDSTLSQSATFLSTDKLSAAGLSSLSIVSNLSVTTARGSSLTLDPASTLTIKSRRIEHNGDIAVHDGTVNFSLIANATSKYTDSLMPNTGYVPVQERIFLAKGSGIDVSGERVDNSSDGSSPGTHTSNYIAGGSISLIDTREFGTEAIVASGSVLDVSGGYVIDSKGKVTGADAGKLTIKAPVVVLDGDLRGYSLAGSAGGQVTLHAKQLNVVNGEAATQLTGSFGATSDLPSGLSGQLTIGDDRFADTGFSRFSLSSQGNIDLPLGINFQPSYVKLAAPTPAGGSSQTQSISNRTASGVSGGETIAVGADYVGTSSFAATAGTSLFTGTYIDPANNPVNDSSYNKQQVFLAEGATISMAPGGKVDLTAPTAIVAGTISAPSGSISVTSTSGNLTVESTGKLLAAGYNKVNSATVDGLGVGRTPVAAGSVKLSSSAKLSLESGSLIDVSGAAPVTNLQLTAGGVPSEVTVAGDAGSLSLSFGNGFLLDGKINAKPGLDNVKGGTFSLTDNGNGLTLTAGLVEQQKRNGFDDLTFRSKAFLAFSEDMALDVGRKLTLDAPTIKGTGSNVIALNAPYLVLQNTTSPATPSVVSDGGKAVLDLLGDWIDIVGAVQVSGFGGISLTAQNSLRLTDHYYSDAAKWGGSLATPGNLTLRAEVIYPTTQANFTLSAGKKITILGNGGTPGPVYSAAGSLTIDGGEGIEQDGAVVAPLGAITLQSANGRVYLGDDSITSTAAESSIWYGSKLNDDLLWTATPHAVNATAAEVTETPDKTVTITGNEIVVKDKATVNIAGGGSVYSYLFQKGIEGSVDPITKSGRYVIMPDNSIQLPDSQAIYIAGGGGIKAGVYSCLPEEYAFLPGAMVVTATGSTVAQGEKSVSAEGYTVVGGYFTTLGTNIKSAQLQGFSVRSAADVLKEGHFEVKEFVAGDAGTLKVSSNSVVLGGTINSAALSGFKGGVLDLSGKQVIVQPDVVSLPDSFDFSSNLPAGSSGTLRIADQTVSGKGLSELHLGDATVTDSVTVTGSSKLDVPNMTLAAKGSISIEAGAELTAHAADGTGSITLTTPLAAQPSTLTTKVTVDDRALVNAGSNVTIQADIAALNGEIRTDHGVTSLIGNNVFVVSSNAAIPANSGFYVTDTLWNGVGEGLSLNGKYAVTFNGDPDLQKLNSLTIDTPRLAGTGQTHSLDIGAANTINLLNSGLFSADNNVNIKQINAPAGKVTFSANDITLGGKSDAGQGLVLLDGFSSITLSSGGDLTLMGQGGIRAGWANSLAGQELVMTGARLVTAPYRDSSGTYQRADFNIDGSHGAVSFSNNAGNAGTSTWAGGRLGMTGDSVTIAGTIDAPAGEIDLTANGSGGIILKSGTQLLSQGVVAPTAETGKYETYAGGTVSLAAAGGPITVEAGAQIDVSAANQGAQGDAGTISLSASTDVVTLNGDLHGIAKAGSGGSLTLDSYGNVDLSALNDKMRAGGFNETIDIRSHTGDLTVAATDTIKAANISLTADMGTLAVNGTLDASGTSTGGMVELNAMNLSLASGSIIDVHGDKGGEVLLNAGGVDASYNPVGWLDVASGAKIVASGATVDSGGTVHFRAPRTADNGDIMMSFNGSVTGAARVEAEAFKVYQYGAGGTDLANMYGEAAGFSANEDAIRTRLGQTGNDIFHLLPGIEIRSAGDITLSAITGGGAWDLTPTRFGANNEPGVLTLRAANNLNIDVDLIDHPTPISDGAGTVLEKTTATPSWSFNLAAGADLNSAAPLAVTTGTGKDLTITDRTTVYTEKGNIGFAAGHDTTIGAPWTSYGFGNGYMISDDIAFNIGTYDGMIRGTVKNDLTLNGGVIQSAVGAIDIETGGNLTLAYAQGDTSLTGTIRTTGEYTPRSVAGLDDNNFPLGFLDYWNYKGGGDIRLRVGKNVTGYVGSADAISGITPGWDMATDDSGSLHWSASYNNIFNPGGSTITTQGIAAMGGGNIAIRSGGAVKGQFGAFGTGDLRISAGGDLSGRFLAKDGAILMTSGGNLAPLAAATQNSVGDGSLFEVFHSTIDVAALGNVTLGTVLNPTIASGRFATGTTGNTNAQANWYLDPGYMDSSVSLSALAGDVTILGKTDLYQNTIPKLANLVSILPPTLDVYAGGSIRLLQTRIALAPSPTGTLRLVAGLDIDGGQTTSIGKFQRGAIYSSDLDPADVYGYHNGFLSEDLFDLTNTHHASTPAHANDADNPNVITANGDIANLMLYLPKETAVTAGGDIKDIYMQWQNVAASDVSSIIAGRDITFTSMAGSDNLIQMGGPGDLLFMAGHSIDLGTTKGIQEVGRTVNFNLPDEKSGLFIAAGTSPDLTTDMVASFFPLARDAGSEYSALLAAGDPAKAKQVVEQFRTEQIAPLFSGASGAAGSGEINMISSQISTSGEGGDIFIVAGGDINVGKSVIGSSQSNTGIFTSAGGAINIFSKGDLNVNESKVMTFRGGDITIWSDNGSVNAGRGSKTAVSVSPPEYKKVSSNPDVYQLVFQPPSVGSGIRAVTYDPDGPSGPEIAPPAGDIFLFAPQGAIDAGEAGIAGGKVTLGATEVINAQNISFSAGSVGVPASSAGSVGIGSLSGTSGLADSSKMIEQTAGAGAAREALKSSTQVLDDFMSKFLDVKVISFDSDEDTAVKDKDKDKHK